MPQTLSGSYITWPECEPCFTQTILWLVKIPLSVPYSYFQVHRFGGMDYGIVTGAEA
jgi:hypothetical protein